MANYNKKIVIAGDKIQVYDYLYPMPKSFKTERTNYQKNGDKKKIYSLQRTRNNLILTINSNVNYYSKFITLTTKETTLNRTEFLKMFKVFKIYFEREFKEQLKYVGVMERQKKRGLKEDNDGSIHLHLIVFNSQKLAFKRLKACWPYGSIDIKKVDYNSNLGVYLAKYLTKDNINDFNKKSLLKSRNLKEPTTIYGSLDFNVNDLKETYRKSYLVNRSPGKLDISKINQCTLTEYILPPKECKSK